MRVADKYLREFDPTKAGTDMQAPPQHEGLNVGAIATVDEVLQKVAEHKGCGTSVVAARQVVDRPRVRVICQLIFGKR